MADLHASVLRTEINPGVAVRLSDRLTRITAPNGGPMTGPGTNTYLVGSDEIIVVDPGPNIASHVNAILQAGAGRIRHIAVTHTHPDHSPAAAVLAKATGAELIGAVLTDDGHQDLTFKPDCELRDGLAIAANDYILTAIFTPGHVGNHYCFHLAPDDIVFTGDHIMQGATVVIIPPSGDMADYLNSLEKLKTYPLRQLAPGHGHLMSEPLQVVQQIIDHRLSREAKVIAALRQMPDSNLDQLMTLVYADVDPRLFKIARLSLWAHLLKLEKEQRAMKHAEEHWLYGDERWRYIG